MAWECFVLLLKSRCYFPLHTLKIVYCSIFHCKISYCVETWSLTYSTYLNCVTILQRRTLRIMTYTKVNHSSAILFQDLNIMSLHKIRDYKIAYTVKNIQHNVPFQPLIFIWPPFQMRNTQTCVSTYHSAQWVWQMHQLLILGWFCGISCLYI